MTFSAILLLCFSSLLFSTTISICPCHCRSLNAPNTLISVPARCNLPRFTSANCAVVPCMQINARRTPGIMCCHPPPSPSPTPSMSPLGCPCICRPEGPARLAKATSECARPDLIRRCAVTSCERINGKKGIGCCANAMEEPSESPKGAVSPSMSATARETLTATPMGSLTPSAIASSTVTPSPTPSVAGSPSPSISAVLVSMIPTVSPSTNPNVSSGTCPCVCRPGKNALSRAEKECTGVAYCVVNECIRGSGRKGFDCCDAGRKPSISPMGSTSMEASFSPDVSVEPSIILSPSPGPSVSMISAHTVSPSVSAGPTVSPSVTHMPTPTADFSARASPKVSMSMTALPSPTASQTTEPSPSPTPRASDIAVESAIPSPSAMKVGCPCFCRPGKNAKKRAQRECLIGHPCTVQYCVNNAGRDGVQCCDDH